MPPLLTGQIHHPLTIVLWYRRELHIGQASVRIDRIVDRHRDHPRFAVVEQLAECDSLFDAHLMITDWSGAALDFGLGLEKPVLFIDVPPKARNDTWPELGIEPFESYVRDKIGAILPPERIAEAPDVIRRLVRDPPAFRQHGRRCAACGCSTWGAAVRRAPKPSPA